MSSASLRSSRLARAHNTRRIVRWLGDHPPASGTATVIPAPGATGLSMAIIAAPASWSGMRSAISSPRLSRPSCNHCQHGRIVGCRHTVRADNPQLPGHEQFPRQGG